MQVEYSTPDSTWDDWKAARVLTGRDFDLEGLAVVNHTYAVCGEEFVTGEPSTQPRFRIYPALMNRNPCARSTHLSDKHANTLNTVIAPSPCSVPEVPRKPPTPANSPANLPCFRRQDFAWRPRL
eukprot:5792304-Pleurochrysis_carterae.AAC.2